MLPASKSGSTERWGKFLCIMHNYLPGVKYACRFEGIPCIDCVAKKQLLPRDAGNEQISAGGGKVRLNCVIDRLRQEPDSIKPNHPRHGVPVQNKKAGFSNHRNGCVSVQVHCQLCMVGGIDLWLNADNFALRYAAA